MESFDQPPYSPDLNSWDFSLWTAVQKRVLDGAPKKRETQDAFKARLRRAARSLPKHLSSKTVAAIRLRAGGREEHQHGLMARGWRRGSRSEQLTRVRTKSPPMRTRGDLPCV